VVKVEVTISELDEEFVRFVIDASTLPSPEGFPLSDPYRELGAEVYDLTMTTLNRLITFLRVEKRQYWLQELEVDAKRMASAFVQFGAIWSADRINWHLWRPTSHEFMSIVLPDQSTWITREDWSKATDHVRSGRSSNFVADLLSTARANAWSGNRRSALVEAVTALEVAISEFAQSPDSEKAFGKLLSERMGVSSLKSQVSHMGNSGTIRYLFPVILPESAISTESLRTCGRAIDERNNVVHNGQRDVSEKKLHNYITAIEHLCLFLIGCTQGTAKLELTF